MTGTKDYKKLAESLQKEVVQLKKQLKVQFQKGVDFARKEAQKLQASYEKCIKNAILEVHKKFKMKMETKPKPKLKPKLKKGGVQKSTTRKINKKLSAKK